MKVRKGFVSNSSSSSFIVGIARIADKAKFDAYVEKKGIKLNEDFGDVYLTSVDGSNRWDLQKVGDRMVVESFQLSASAAIKSPTDIFFVVNISNDEGDGPFWSDIYEEYNYDIDIDYFMEDEQAVYAAFFDAESGLEMSGDASYGAARNG
jgi:hypothetical protein